VELLLDLGLPATVAAVVATIIAWLVSKAYELKLEHYKTQLQGDLERRKRELQEELETSKASLQKDIEQYKSEIKLAADSQLERVKYSLQLSADYERQRREAVVELSELVERSFVTMRAFDLDWLSAQNIQSQLTLGSDFPDRVTELYMQLSEWLVKHRIYFDNEDIINLTSQYNSKVFGYLCNLQSFYQRMLEQDSSGVTRCFDDMTRCLNEAKPLWGQIRLFLSESTGARPSPQ
jgi:hypothetical protein